MQSGGARTTAALEVEADDAQRNAGCLHQPGKTGFVKPKGEIPTDAELHGIQDYLKTFDLAE